MLKKRRRKRKRKKTKVTKIIKKKYRYKIDNKYQKAKFKNTNLKRRHGGAKWWRSRMGRTLSPPQIHQKNI